MTGHRLRRAVLALLVAGATMASAAALPRLAPIDPAALAGRPMTLADARPVLAALGSHVPLGLREWAAPDAETRWSAWLKARDAEIRRRLGTGDEDSVVNLMLYGTTFTRWPRATPAATSTATLDDVMKGRVADLAAAIESPGEDERLRFARQVVERHGIAVGGPTRDATGRYLTELRSRVLSENERYMRRQAVAAAADLSQQRSAQATLYSDRGLSSDTSLRIDFALEQTLAALRDRGALARGTLERVAVVGPGLDFVDKAQGYDFYPVQIIQPFALADSLRRLGAAAHPMVTTLDISPRVLAHVEHARQRAAAGRTYRLHLLLAGAADSVRLDPALVGYWQRFGNRVGTPATSEVPAAYTGDVQARAVDVRAETVLDVRGAALNVVLERLASNGPSSRFGLVVATNVLVYYDPFEQALAVCNMASMLGEGGLLLTNQPVPVPAVCGLSPALIMSVAFDRIQSPTGPHERGESISVYRKA